MLELAYDIQQLPTCPPSPGCQQQCHGLRIPANRLTLIISPDSHRRSAMLDALAGRRGQVCGQLFGQPLSRGQSTIARLGPDSITHSRLRLGDFVMQTRSRQHWLARPQVIDHEAVSQALHTVGLSDQAQQKLGTLTATQRQLACLAQKLASHAPVLLLDDPANLLAHASRATLLRKLAALALHGRTIVCAMPDKQPGQQYAHWLIQPTADGRLLQGMPEPQPSPAMAA